MLFTVLRNMKFKRNLGADCLVFGLKERTRERERETFKFKPLVTTVYKNVPFQLSTASRKPNEQRQSNHIIFMVKQQDQTREEKRDRIRSANVIKMTYGILS